MLSGYYLHWPKHVFTQWPGYSFHEIKPQWPGYSFHETKPMGLSQFPDQKREANIQFETAGAPTVRAISKNKRS